MSLTDTYDTPAPIPEPSGPSAATISHPADLLLRVYYEDTDAAGVVYYANYLRFCERARTEWLRALGFSQQAMFASEGLAFVVTRMEADYLRGAELDDWLRVASEVAASGRASLVFRQRVWRGETLLFDSRVTIACVDMTSKRPRRLPAALADLLPSRLPRPSDNNPSDNDTSTEPA
ncbi:tol-pal system-associated acyl-CoA thioesterase [Uliginosibacterium sp. H1]|uniref:tol-pal system-associated acyl-CoA thioesterase n=1 Tax=Uliginosibacterium sp. H1 TaxID=3114757 RepID=UPI002E16BC43|nr:tol-pal system-associated acyl-CoA thioesterase [Uliginosibacterium sp. H1]